MYLNNDDRPNLDALLVRLIMQLMDMYEQKQEGDGDALKFGMRSDKLTVDAAPQPDIMGGITDG